MRVKAVLSLVVTVVFVFAVAACKQPAPVQETTGSMADLGKPGTTSRPTASVEDFCQAVEDSKEDLSSSDPSHGPVQYLTGLRKVQKKATKEVKLDIDALVKLVSVIDDLPDDEAGAKLKQLNESPEFIRSYRAFNRYVQDKCNVNLAKTGTTVRNTTRRTTVVTDETTPTSGSAKTAQQALDELKTFLNDKYGTTAWIGKLSGLKVTIQTSKNTADFTLGTKAGETMTPDEAVAACTAVAEYIDSVFSNGKSIITDTNEKPIASRPEKDAPCTAS